MVLEVYLATIIISFVTELVTDIYRLNSVINYDKQDLGALDLIRIFKEASENMGIIKATFVMMPSYLIITLIKSSLPVLNVINSTLIVNKLYQESQLKPLDSIDYLVNYKENIINEETMESLRIDGADKKVINIVLKDEKKEIKEEIKEYRNKLIDENARSIFDYICMNADLTNKQKEKLLKKLKKAYSKSKFNVEPIDYTFKCIIKNEEKILSKKSK